MRFDAGINICRNGVSKTTFCLSEIADGSGGVLMCGSCIERFDPRSILTKLARKVDSR